MKKQTMYTRLKDQYNQLTKRMQKTIKCGQFYNHSMNSLKNLGMGVATCVALGTSTSAVAQYTPPVFTPNSGTDNPFHAFIRTGGVQENMDDRITFDAKPTFPNENVHYAYISQYGYTYQGIDSFITAFTQFRRNITINDFPYSLGQYIYQSPLRGFEGHNIGPKHMRFVDINGDGKDEIISGSYSDVNNGLIGYVGGSGGYSPDPKVCQYFERTSTSIINAQFPFYDDIPTSSNPLDMVNTMVFQPDSVVTDSTLREFAPALVDIDGDGDLDCIGLEMGEIVDYSFAVKKNNIAWYENTGTVTSPTFVRHSTTNNPFSGVSAYIADWHVGKLGIDLIDFDNDNDYDLFIHSTVEETVCVENTGTNINPVFDVTNGFSTNHLLSNIASLASSVGGKIVNLTLVDFDSDGDLDAFNRPSNEPGVCQDALYLRNDGPMMVGLQTFNNQVYQLDINPNPVTVDQVQFGKAMTGTLAVYDLSGKELLAKEIQEQTMLDVSTLDNGLYIISIETEDGLYQEKVRIER